MKTREEARQTAHRNPSFMLKLSRFHPNERLATANRQNVVPPAKFPRRTRRPYSIPCKPPLQVDFSPHALPFLFCFFPPSSLSFVILASCATQEGGQFAGVGDSPRGGGEGEEDYEEGGVDEGDDAADEEDEGRFAEDAKAADDGEELVFVETGGFGKGLGEVAGGFADGRHAREHRQEFGEGREDDFNIRNQQDIVEIAPAPPAR